ncbi:rCG59985 [Rattus norvegicus]|uniref:RCG59985 n=1 Tax=Rattus norvegicus TaxID=10116 RepID=A6HRT1_RAT|nr:rCG59985 [Rattus norvegicus]
MLYSLTLHIFGLTSNTSYQPSRPGEYTASLDHQLQNCRCKVTDNHYHNSSLSFF